MINVLGRTFNGTEAVSLGLALKCFPSKSALEIYAQDIAQTIAKKSPLTIR